MTQEHQNTPRSKARLPRACAIAVSLSIALLSVVRADSPEPNSTASTPQQTHSVAFRFDAEQAQPAAAPSAANQPTAESVLPGQWYAGQDANGSGHVLGFPQGAYPGDYDCPPVSPFRCGVACQPGGACYEMRWKAARPIPWQIFAQGEYVGPHRLRHVPEYRLRVDDRLALIFRLTTIPTTTPYELTVGDTLKVESFSDKNLEREVIIQPDGTVSLSILGQVRVAGRSIADVVADLDEQYKKYVHEPKISITPLKLNTKLEELRATVDARQGFGGQSRDVRVTPEGTIQLPGIGSVPAQGLTLGELKREIDARYQQLVHGFEVTPILQDRAPRYIFVLGEVSAPGRYELVGPTTVMQSIALAGGWNVGGNLDHVVVFRRDDCWQLMATKLEIHHALFGKRPCPADEIWLRDSDVVVVPKRPIKVADDAIELIFTRGLYGIVPFNFSVFHSLGTVGNIVQ